MKKQFKTILMFLSLGSLIFISSCKKEKSFNYDLNNETVVTDQKIKLQTAFAKALATAVYKDESLRKFLKSESLKQFNNDDDILYNLVKDIEVNNGETFREKISKFLSGSELNKIENSLPLLTIFIPTIPNFNPQIWKPETDIPVVAVANKDSKGSVSLYDNLGKSISLKPSEVPGFPVLVIKDNERVSVNNEEASNGLVIKSLGNGDINCHTPSLIRFMMVFQKIK